MTLDIAIQKGTKVTIHEQLVTQIALQIASGKLTEGTKLPSVRALSRKLDIHYNTCLGVYKELAEHGLVLIKPGSGVVVNRYMAPAISAETAELNLLARQFVEQVKGYAWGEVEAALNAARQQQRRQGKVVFVDKNEDILPLFQVELEEALERPVETVTLSGLSIDSWDVPPWFIVSRYHQVPVKQVLQGQSDVRLQVIEVNSGQEDMRLIRDLPEGALVVVVSQSSILLQIAESIALALRGDGILFRAIHTSEGWDEIRQAARYASLIYGDAITGPHLKGMSKGMVQTIRLVPAREAETLRQQIGVGVALD